MKEIMMDPDLEVIGMVNAGVSTRQRIAENRKVLRQMARDQQQCRKENWWRAFRDMALEAGAYATAGIMSLVTMAQGLISPRLAVPIFVICLVWTAIRVDRFVRR